LFDSGATEILEIGFTFWLMRHNQEVGEHLMNKLSLLLVPLLAVAIAIPAQGAAPQ